MHYHFKIHKEKKGYWGECVELSGCQTQADSKEELLANMKEALELFLDEPEDSTLLFPLPRKRLSGPSIVEVAVSPRVALAFRLRQARLSRSLTQKEACELIGLKGLYSYQRLENSETANPEWETLVRIKRVFSEIEIDELLSSSARSASGRGGKNERKTA